MDDTEYKLKGLNAGEFQRLAFELLPRVNDEWNALIHSGAVEGTNITRKGTPDMWMRARNGRLVYVQVTTDAKTGKMYEDVNKSVESLLDLGMEYGATCIAFVNSEPQSKEVLRCQQLCEQHGCDLVLFHNSKIAKALNHVANHDLRKKFLNISPDMPKKEKTTLTAPEKTKEKTSDPQIFVILGVILSVVTMVFYLSYESMIIGIASSVFITMTLVSVIRIYRLSRSGLFRALDKKYKLALYTPIFSWLGALAVIFFIKYPFYSSEGIEMVRSKIIDHGMNGIVPRIIELFLNNTSDITFLLLQSVSLWFLVFLVLILLAFEVFHSSHIILSVRRNRNNKGLKVLGYINKRTSFSQSMVFLNVYLIVVAVLLASGLFVNLMGHFNNSTMAILK